MAEPIFFFYGLLVTFVLVSMRRTRRTGSRPVPQLLVAAWSLFVFSLGGAAWLSLSALSEALSA